MGQDLAQHPSCTCRSSLNLHVLAQRRLAELHRILEHAHIVAVCKSHQRQPSRLFKVFDPLYSLTLGCDGM